MEDRRTGEKEHPIMRICKLALSVIYISLLIYIVFFARRRKSIHQHYLNLVPIKVTIHDFFLTQVHHDGRYNFYSNLIGNILLFIPFPMVLMNYLRTVRLKPVILAGIAVSCCIEMIQYVLEIGFSDIDDVLLNTLGTMIGAAGYKTLKKHFFPERV